MMKMILAMDKNGCIGKGNGLPWHIPMDLAWFKRTTMGHPVVMGRKTRESIGRDLPGRENIILTTQGNDLTMFDWKMKVLSRAMHKDVFIIGGGSIYEQFVEYCDRIFICHVDTEIEGGDTFFKHDLSGYRKFNVEAVEPCVASGGYALTFIEYRR